MFIKNVTQKNRNGNRGKKGCLETGFNDIDKLLNDMENVGCINIRDTVEENAKEIQEQDEGLVREHDKVVRERQVGEKEEEDGNRMGVDDKGKVTEEEIGDEKVTDGRQVGEKEEEDGNRMGVDDKGKVTEE